MMSFSLFATLFVFVACSGKGELMNQEAPCTPGGERECSCPGRERAGVQSCLADGNGWTACRCHEEGDAGLADSGAEPDRDAGTGSDAAAEPIPPHIKGWWSLDTDMQDRSGLGNHCAAAGQAAIVQDAQRGGVLSLDGDGDYLDCGSGPTLDLTGPMTVAAWVKVRAFDRPWQAFIGRNGEECGWKLRRYENLSAAGFAVRGTTGDDDLKGAANLDDGRWHHVAGVYDGASRLIYVDGAVDARMADSGSVFSCPADRVLIGAFGAAAYGYGFDPHNGWLDDVRVYDAALSDREIRALAGVGFSASNPDPRDGARCVDDEVSLSWEPGEGATSHHVYFGNDLPSVQAAGDPNVLPGRGAQAGVSFDPGRLQKDVTYYWRIDEVSRRGIEKGPVWSFSVCDGPPGFVAVAGGSFTMGVSPGDNQACRTECGWPFDIEKPHRVIISRPFWIKATEVTRAEWRAVTGSLPGTPFTGCGDNCPLDGATWFQIAAFANALSNREGLAPCYYQDEGGAVPYDFAAAERKAQPTWPMGPACEGYRLPTEAEWEYAARAGTETPYFNGAATAANLDGIGWYGANSGCGYAGCEQDNCRSGAGNIPPSGPQPVARKTPNPLGLYDTAGNLWEFVWDRFGEYHDGPVTDPTGPVSSAAGFHVARGGSWLNGTAEARVSTRDGDDCTCDPDNGPGSHTGFRLARTKP